jgi:hypothetical protein
MYLRTILNEDLILEKIVEIKNFSCKIYYILFFIQMLNCFRSRPFIIKQFFHRFTITSNK